MIERDFVMIPLIEMIGKDKVEEILKKRVEEIFNVNNGL